MEEKIYEISKTENIICDNNSRAMYKFNNVIISYNYIVNDCISRTQRNSTIEPIVHAHILNSIKHATKQIDSNLMIDDKFFLLPAEELLSIRFPAIDPIGKSSIIEMKFEQRLLDLHAVLKFKPEHVNAYFNEIKDTIISSDIYKSKIENDMIKISKIHKYIVRAFKLCINSEAQKILKTYRYALELDMAVIQYDQFIQGLEYISGERQGPVPTDVVEFYDNILNLSLDLKKIEIAQKACQIPEEIDIHFENLDNIILQSRFSDPQNWDTPLNIIKKSLQNINIATELYNEKITPYAIATINRALSPICKATDDIAMLIMLKGKTLVDMLKSNEFIDLNALQKQTLIFKYIIVILMQNNYAEIYTPDHKHLIKLTKSGYSPSKTQQATFSAWEIFFNKYNDL